MYNIMLIDDEKTILHGLTSIIDWSKHNYHLSGAFSSSLEALDFFYEHPVDIVITDLMMPELTGIELAGLMKKRKPNSKILVLSSYDDFVLVKDSFKEGVSDYLLKPKLTPNILLSTLNALSEKIPKDNVKKELSKEELISRELSNYFSGIHTERTLSQKSFSYPHFFLIYTEDEITLSGENNEKQKVSVNYSSKSLDIFSFKTNKNDYGFLINTASEKEFSLLINVFQKENKHIKNSLFIYSAQLDQDNLYQSFLTIQKLGKGQKFYHKNELIIPLNSLTMLQPTYDHNPSKYLTSIVNKDYLHALEELKNYTLTLLHLKLTPSYLKHETINQFYALINSLNDTYAANEKIAALKLSLPSQLSNADCLEDFSLLITQTIYQLMEIIPPAKTDSYEILTLVYEYVQENYHEEISLQSISEKFHFSYSYFSTLFTEKYGINFTKYLKKVRITKAKELLKNPSLPLSEIYNKVGFTELGYFSRVFKEETGITPSHYRKGKLNK
ncbi:helix-turn-helix domain-containing protein [Enterococcus sp. BWB1-3]|uniref:response regulator transcription factor n=1 Tax=Enterococcus sp. BWT-B8 TaxID=2885157 RepID=UPI00192506EC|nr:helix-turn-helix domain-containing protein [Enterococcus sp. BWT-B8]MBL1229071.1 helix-turn-helix domain-containing protein [Enterococcus sp. BWB1-3]MCB5953074.1 helix-turn-helix domain-containing protein [Enterococcus sp. BWT-B8]